MHASRSIVEKMVRALYAIAIGGLFWVLDLKLSIRLQDAVLSFDLLHDAAGMALIAAGLASLSQLVELRRSFQYSMAGLAGAAVTCALWAIAVQARPELSSSLVPFSPMLRLALFVSFTLFCWKMRQACLDYELTRSGEGFLGLAWLVCASLLASEAIVQCSLALLGPPQTKIVRALTVTAVAVTNSAPFALLLATARRLRTEASEKKAQDD